MNRRRVVLAVVGAVAVLAASGSSAAFAARRHPLRLYWFIADGMRADPGPWPWDIYRLAREGAYPNIKKMMERGSYGYSLPAFPSHTPSNFATLLTGSFPEIHGVSDGPMRPEGAPLATPALNGFASTARKVPSLWDLMEERGFKVSVLSVPGSTPPEDGSESVVRGRWGHWGADFPALIFDTIGFSTGTPDGGGEGFFAGRRLRLYPQASAAKGWRLAPVSRLPPLEISMLGYGTTVYALLFDDGAAPAASYSKVLISLDKRRILATLSRDGEWSSWLPVDLHWGKISIPTHMRICRVLLKPDGGVEIRILYDVLNSTVVEPSGLAGRLEGSIGPMVDFPDNWPAQLNRRPEEMPVLLAETRMALDWHRRAVGSILKAESPDVLIQDTYVPNQVLESRWWLCHVDPDSPDFSSSDPHSRELAAADLRGVYAGLDAILGAALKAAGPETYVVLSSDHGIIPIKKELRINNLLAREGLLQAAVGADGVSVAVDWGRSQAAYLQMLGVYVKPEGLAGNWRRGQGREYLALRRRVRKLLERLRGPDGEKVFDAIVPWEKADKLRLPKDRVPDLILATRPGYDLSETLDRDRIVFARPLQSGYKHSTKAELTRALWTPFIVMGPGIKKGYAMAAPIRHVDQAPTLMSLLGIQAPSFMQGRVVRDILNDKERPR